LDAFLARRLQDHRVEPLADRHAGATRGFPRGFERLAARTPGLPRHISCHAHIRVLNGEGPDSMIVYKRYPDGAALCPRAAVFQPKGKQTVNDEAAQGGIAQ
jgi:hypothetical protein